MNNTRFATAIHILTLLAKDPQEWLTSDWIAGSVNVNPVIVRKELINLKKSGLIESRQGKVGGVRIAKNPEQINISEIYESVKNTEVLGKRNQNRIRFVVLEKTSTKILIFYLVKRMIWFSSF
jgi:Rrf2 family protein